MIALLAAMSQEIAPLRNSMKVEQKASERGCHMYKGKYRGRDVILVQTGVGRRRAQRAARLAMERYPVGAMVSFGFAGALDGRARCGDVVVCDALFCGDGEGTSKHSPASCFRADAFLTEVAARAPASADYSVLRASSVTVSRVVCEAGAKKALGQEFSAGAVDMESYWIAEIAHAQGVPFVTVRAISDAADDTLPPFDRFMDSNGWRWGKALPFFAGHPDQLVRLWRLRRSMRQPARNLTGVLNWLVDNVRV